MATPPKKVTGPVTDPERARIIEVFKVCDSVGETARRTGRSKPTVSRVLIAAGFEPSGRRFTRAANEANAEDARTRRGRLAVLWRDAEERTLRRALGLDSERYHLVKGTGSGRVIDQHVDVVPADDFKHLMTGAAIASDKASILERLDAPREGQGRGRLEDLVESLHKGRGGFDGK